MVASQEVRLDFGRLGPTPEACRVPITSIALRANLLTRPNPSRSPPCGELSPKATEGSVADSVTARIRTVSESETDPLIRYADLSPARRGTAKMRGFGLLLS